MATPDAGDRSPVLLRLTPLPDCYSRALSLRRLLKYALRSCRLRADEIRPEPQESTMEQRLIKCDCGASIFFVKTVNDKRIPLDVGPAANGNIVLRDGIAHYLKKDEQTSEPRYVAHFATCPNAAQHRKK
jgi:hypothetical protein